MEQAKFGKLANPVAASYFISWFVVVASKGRVGIAAGIDPRLIRPRDWIAPRRVATGSL